MDSAIRKKECTADGIASRVQKIPQVIGRSSSGGVQGKVVLPVYGWAAVSRRTNESVRLMALHSALSFDPAAAGHTHEGCTTYNCHSISASPLRMTQGMPPTSVTAPSERSLSPSQEACRVVALLQPITQRQGTSSLSAPAGTDLRCTCIWILRRVCPRPNRQTLLRLGSAKTKSRESAWPVDS